MSKKVTDLTELLAMQDDDLFLIYEDSSMTSKKIKASNIIPAGVVTINAIQTLTNKTLTSPVINTPTGITKTDVGLGSVDNTSDPTKLSAFLLAAYPVGAIYVSVVNTNPGTLFGGTWTVFGAGKTLVSLDTGDTDFDTVEETGGEKAHKLSGLESGIAVHSHSINDPTHVHTFVRSTTTGGASTRFYQGNAPTSQTSSTDSNGAATGITINNTVATDATNSHNNLQPYIVTYMWKRTA